MDGQNIAGGFDLSQVLAQANKVKADAEEGGGSKEKLIYPQVGTIKVKLLFTPKSQVVIRKFERHTVGDNKVPCLAQYGMECPICKILGDIENAKGLDLWKNKRTSRGICYAEYVSDTYKWDKPNDKPQPGEIIMLMFPWTIYQDLNRIMSNAGPNLAQIVASNVGAVINIERYVQNGQTKYSAAIDAFDMNHQTRPTDQEYNDLLMGLDDLNEKFCPSSVNDNVIAKAKEVAEQLSKEYLNPAGNQPNMGNSGSSFGAMAGGMPQQPPVPNPNYYRDPNTGIEYDLVNNQWIPRMQQTPPPTPTTPPVPNTPPQNNLGGLPPQNNPVGNQQGSMNPPVGNTAPDNASGNPECYGKHGDASINPNQCLVCFKEAECSACSNH